MLLFYLISILSSKGYDHSEGNTDNDDVIVVMTHRGTKIPGATISCFACRVTVVCVKYVVPKI